MADRPTEPAEKARTEARLGKVVDAGVLQLAWGTPAVWKAQWRDESLHRHLALPMKERLRVALSLVIRRSDDDSGQR